MPGNRSRGPATLRCATRRGMSWWCERELPDQTVEQTLPRCLAGAVRGDAGAAVVGGGHGFLFGQNSGSSLSSADVADVADSMERYLDPGVRELRPGIAPGGLVTYA